MTDPITTALDRLQEYAQRHPEHDTDEIVQRARAAWAEPAADTTTVRPLVFDARYGDTGPPTPPSISKRPSNWELLATINKAVINFPPSHPQAQPLNGVEYELSLELRKARAVLARWGQPPAPPTEGEVAKLVAKLRRLAPQNPLGSADPTLTRAAELLERHAADGPLPAPQGGEVEL